MLDKKILLTGIGTDVGKTIVAQALCSRFSLPYWKPVQCGDLDNSDTMKLQALNIETFPERFSFTEPLSPHHAAAIDGVQVKSGDFILPDAKGIVVEGAGGVMVPMNDESYCFPDLAIDLGLDVVLVSNNYLGSINHTLLSIHHILRSGLNLLGIIISGKRYPEGEKIYLKTGVKIIGHLPQLDGGQHPGEALEWYGLD